MSSADEKSRPGSSSDEADANRIDPNGQDRAGDDANPDGDGEEPTPFVLLLPDDPASGKDWYLWAGVLALLLATAFWPAIRGTFLWDDDRHILNNHALTERNGLVKIWTDLHAEPQYYPLTHTTFWIENQLWGKNPIGYHVTNIVLHALSAILVWRLLRRLAVPGAFVAAALWAVHPVQAESVAWMTERKNVLSGLLFFASIWFYLDFAGGFVGRPEDLHKPVEIFKDRWGAYIAALVLFAMALLSKTVAVAMPPVMLVILWWKDRLNREAVLGLIPHFIIGLIFARLTASLETGPGGLIRAQGKDWDYDLIQRFLIAGHAIWFYVGKLLVPIYLTFSYEKWTISKSDPILWIYLLAAIGALVLVYVLRDKIGRGPTAAALWFGICLFPSLGFFNIFPMRYTLVADHYQYLASLGIIVLVVSIIARWFNQFTADRAKLAALTFPVLMTPPVSSEEKPAGETAGGETPAGETPPLPIETQVAIGIGLVVLLGMGILTWMQSNIYWDMTALWRDTLNKNPTSWLASYNLGIALENDAVHDRAAGDRDSAAQKLSEARTLFQQTLVLHPNDEYAHGGIGHADMKLFELLRPPTASTQPIDPAVKEMADTFVKEAKAELLIAIHETEHQPERFPGVPEQRSPYPYINLGTLLVMQHTKQDAEEALGYLNMAIKILSTPDPRTHQLPAAILQSAPHFQLSEAYYDLALYAEEQAAADAKAGDKVAAEKARKLAEGYWAGALAEANDTVTLDPANSDALLRYARLLEHGGDTETTNDAKAEYYSKAIAAIGLFMRMNPMNAEGYNQMGELRAITAQSDRDLYEAGQFIYDALNLRPDYPEAKANKDRIIKMMRGRMSQQRKEQGKAATQAATQAAAMDVLPWPKKEQATTQRATTQRATTQNSATTQPAMP